MRSAILAFAFGILILQMQADLSYPFGACAALGMIIFALSMRLGRTSARACSWEFAGSMGLLLSGMALLGFAWAGWRAQARLSDALPAAWEGRDVTLTGVVSGLPQRFAQGERFAFEVESVETPGAHVPRRIQLAWYEARGRSRAGGESASKSASVPPGNPAARPAISPAADVTPGDDAGATGVADKAPTGGMAARAMPMAAGAGAMFAADAVDADRRPPLLEASQPAAMPQPQTRPAVGRVRPGERWRLTVRLRRPHGNANPHGFDYEAWLLERNIRALGTVRPDRRAENAGDAIGAGMARVDHADGTDGAAHRPDAADPHHPPNSRHSLRSPKAAAPGAGGNARLNAFVARPAYLVERLREAVRERFFAALPDAPYRGVLAALAIGDQRAIPAAQWTLFSRTGVTHLVSISGLHVTMLAALFAALANWLWRRSERLMLRLSAQRAALVAGWLAACAYALLAGFEAPVQRTLYMLSAAGIAVASGRHFGASRILCLALFAVLFIDPWAVLSVGFWLSFGAVAALLHAGGGRLGLSARAARGPARWRDLVIRWGAAQWAVTAGGLPLLLLFFQQFSLVSPLANALAIPFVSLIITPLTLLCAALPWPWLLHADHWLLARLMDALAALSAWPVWQQPAPPLWTAALALPGIAWLLLPRGFPARWLGIAPLLPALCWQAPRPSAGEAWIDTLDVGQGLAVVVRTARHTLLYDAGPRYSGEADAGQRIVAPFLRAVGVKRLDTLLISHNDADHAGGVESIRAALPVARTLSSDPRIFGGEACAAGQRWEWDGVRFRILHPLSALPAHLGAAARPTVDDNARSCVLKIETAGSAALLPGDIEAKTEAALLARAAAGDLDGAAGVVAAADVARGMASAVGAGALNGMAGAEMTDSADKAEKAEPATTAALRSDMLIVPHHGSRGASTSAFLAAVDAREAVFSAGYRNAFGHPQPETLARHAAQGSQLWRTDADGAIHARLSARVEVSAWRQTRRRYWHAP